MFFDSTTRRTGTSTATLVSLILALPAILHSVSAERYNYNGAQAFDYSTYPVSR